MNAIALYRLGHWCHLHRIPLVPRGARILGAIRVGRGSAVGANAVVLEDVPPGCAVAGVPARIVRSNIDIRDYWA